LTKHRKHQKSPKADVGSLPHHRPPAAVVIAAAVAQAAKPTPLPIVPSPPITLIVVVPVAVKLPRNTAAAAMDGAEVAAVGSNEVRQQVAIGIAKVKAAVDTLTVVIRAVGIVNGTENEIDMLNNIAINIDVAIRNETLVTLEMRMAASIDVVLGTAAAAATRAAAMANIGIGLDLDPIHVAHTTPIRPHPRASVIEIILIM